MGSKLSRATREAKPGATQPAATSHFNEDQERTCQDARGHEQTDHDTTAASATSSDPPPATSTAPLDIDAMDIDQPPRESTDSDPDSSAFRRFLQRHLGNMTGGPEDSTSTPAPQPQHSEEQTTPPPSLPSCLICSQDIDASKALYPCSKCENAFCAPCLKSMYVDACTDLSRMPPRCCVQIQFHHVRPYLSQDEIDLFKAKYDEWGTPNPFYCPVARCSAFIPNHLLPSMRANEKGKQRVDSGVGTPTMQTVSCPKCEANICTSCRNLAHEDGICNPLQFHGIDKETAELIERWGYKQCPKCGNGVKRMFGCSHMECRCGAHFCWGCLRSYGVCGGGCDEGSEDDYSDWEPDMESEFDRDEEKEREQEQEQEGQTETSTPPEPNLAHVFPHLSPASQTEDDSTNPATETSAPTATVDPAEPSKEEEEVPPPRIRNLDGGAHGYWEDQVDLDFGDEPTEEHRDPTWDCNHDFSTAKLTLTEAFTSHPPDTVVECMKCWTRIHPEITMPVTTKTVAWTTAAKTKRRRIDPPARDEKRGTSTLRPSRSLEGLDAAATTPLSSSPASFYSAYSVRMRSADDPSKWRVIDLYGDAVDRGMRPADLTYDNGVLDGTSYNQENQETEQSASQTKGTPFSFAYECETCAVLVCQGCKEHLESVRHGWDEEDEEEE